MLFLPNEPLAENVFCFTTTIHGGVSAAPYQSFNVGLHVKDQAERVLINRELLRAIIKQQVLNRQVNNAALPTKTSFDQSDTQQYKHLDNEVLELTNIAPIKWLNQQHSNIVKNYEEIVQDDSELSSLSEICDGIYSEHRNTPLVVMTADCLPIVIACTKSGQVAAVHAGWRGLLNNVIANAIAQFEYPSALRVWIGPSIKQQNFTVSEDVIDQFSKFDFAVTNVQNTDKFQIDLVSIATSQFAQAGVFAVEASPICTYTSKDCFSHRKATHSGLAQTGRMATVILRV